MKIYLSKYWIADHISLVCVEVAVVVATVVFCIEYRDADIIMIKGLFLLICAIQASTSVEKIMDWQLKGGLYIDHNKFYGCADIHDYVVGNFRNRCLRFYKVQESKGSLESVIIWKSSYIDSFGHKQSYRGIRTRYSFI